MNQEEAVQAGDGQVKPGWRIKTGFTLFILSIGWPVLIPVFPFIGLSGTQIAAISGVMLVVAELMIVAGVAIAQRLQVEVDSVETLGAQLFDLGDHGAPPVFVFE